MNERIKELKQQAVFVANKGFTLTGSHKIWTGQFAEKFAELIVLECVRYFNEDYQRDFNTLWREDLSKGMKEHFGVEE